VSSTVGAPNTGVALLPDDPRVYVEWWSTSDFLFVADGLNNGGHAGDDFWQPWWPGAGSAGLYGDAGDVQPSGSVWHTRPEVTNGSNSRFSVTGITRDVYGSPVGGVTVKLFATGTDILMDQQTSDANTGSFTLSTYLYPDSHYIVAYKAGSPDVQGSSVNTIIGA